MMIKIVLGVLFVATSSIIGLRLTERKRFVKDFFQKLKSFNLELSADVGLYYTPLSEKLKIFCLDSDDSIKGYECIMNGEEFVCRDKRLSKDQRLFVSGYVNSLGKFDEEGQIKFLEKTDERIDGYLSASKETFAKYSALSFKLSFCLGLVIFILIV